MRAYTKLHTQSMPEKLMETLMKILNQANTPQAFLRELCDLCG